MKVTINQMVFTEKDVVKLELTSFIITNIMVSNNEKELREKMDFLNNVHRAAIRFRDLFTYEFEESQMLMRDAETNEVILIVELL